MENYICINGNKTALTEEQMKNLGFSFGKSIAEISQIVKSGKARDHFKIYDILNLSGYELEIIGFDHDKDASGKAAHTITLMAKTLLDNKRMNVGSCERGWVDTELRNWLNSTFLDQLPDELVQHICTVEKITHNYKGCTPAPRLEADLPDSTSEYAAEGTLAHSVCELLARKKFTIVKPSAHNAALKKLKKEPLWQDEMLTTANAYVDHLAERSMEFEHKPYMAFEVKVDITDYAPEAFGTCDCVMIGGNELIITDYKHGKGVPVSAEGNPQMMLYALGALKLYRPIYGEAIQRVTCYIDQPRLDSYSKHSMTVAELLAWGESTVKPKAALAFAGLGNFTPGDHCRFCRAKAQCRARANAHTALEDFKDCTPAGAVKAGDLVPQEFSHIGPHGAEVHPLLSDAEIGDLLTRGKALVDWYNSLEEYALTAVLNGGTIPGYKVVEGTSKATFAPDFDTAAKVLIAAGFEKATLYREMPETLTNIDKVVGGRTKLKELLGDHLYKPPGKPALAPESDKRPAYSGAAADFGGEVS